MDYYKSFEVRMLNIYIGFMIRMVKYFDYLHFVWKKVILRQSDYKKSHKFPFAINDLNEDVQNKLQEDFKGTVQNVAIFIKTPKALAMCLKSFKH